MVQTMSGLNLKAASPLVERDEEREPLHPISDDGFSVASSRQHLDG